MRPLATARLQLRPAEPRWAVAMADFYARNAAHLAPWDPRRPGMDDPARQVEWLSMAATAAEEGRSLRWLLSLDGQQVVGTIGVSNVSRGFFQSANLGYALDASLEGQGLMREALEAVIAEVFGPGVNLHRLQAAYLPENTRSGGLLQRLGFRPIGLAHQHLFIDGAWRDHLLTELINPAGGEPGSW